MAHFENSTVPFVLPAFISLPRASLTSPLIIASFSHPLKATLCDNHDCNDVLLRGECTGVIHKCTAIIHKCAEMIHRCIKKKCTKKIHKCTELQAKMGVCMYFEVSATDGHENIHKTTASSIRFL